MLDSIKFKKNLSIKNMVNLVTETRKYCCTLIVKGKGNKSETQLLAYNYLKLLKKLGAVNMSAYTKNEYQLSYPIQKNNHVTFIEFSFVVSPGALNEFKAKIKLDEGILRYFLVKED